MMAALRLPVTLFPRGFGAVFASEAGRDAERRGFSGEDRVFAALPADKRLALLNGATTSVRISDAASTAAQSIAIAQTDAPLPAPATSIGLFRRARFFSRTS
jgi:hypothetical protein